MTSSGGRTIRNHSSRVIIAIVGVELSLAFLVSVPLMILLQGVVLFAATNLARTSSGRLSVTTLSLISRLRSVAVFGAHLVGAAVLFASAPAGIIYYLIR